MTYGIIPYGFGGYGGATATISLAGAWALSTNEVQVETTSAALANDSFDEGDALNPTTWTISLVDPTIRFTPIYVRRVPGTNRFIIRTLEALGSHLVTHQISSFTLHGAMGALIVAPYTAQFLGLVSSIDPVIAARRRPLVRDLANPFRVSQQTSDPVSAILMDANGDYATEEDIAVARKGILRRITTPKGSIRHLPGYGFGFAEKALIPYGGDRTAIRIEIERQVLQEPGIKQVRAAFDVLAADISRIRVRARMSGAQLEVTARRMSDGTIVET